MSDIERCLLALLTETETETENIVRVQELKLGAEIPRRRHARRTRHTQT